MKLLSLKKRFLVVIVQLFWLTKKDKSAGFSKKIEALIKDKDFKIKKPELFTLCLESHLR